MIMRLFTQSFMTLAIATILGMVIALSATIVTATPALPEEGLDYQVISSTRPAKIGKKIEVVEFFWYDCPHCNVMLPLIEPWAKRQRHGIAFKRIPVARNEAAIVQQRLYYALETLGKVEALHDQIFYAIHDEKMPMNTLEQMADFLEEQGIGKQQFLRTIHSDTVKKKVQLAQQLTAYYGIDSVPTIVINRRYVTSATILGGNQADVLPVVDYLVSKSRQRLN